MTLFEQSISCGASEMSCADSSSNYFPIAESVWTILLSLSLSLLLLSLSLLLLLLLLLFLMPSDNVQHDLQHWSLVTCPREENLAKQIVWTISVSGQHSKSFVRTIPIIGPAPEINSLDNSNSNSFVEVSATNCLCNSNSSTTLETYCSHNPNK